MDDEKFKERMDQLNKRLEEVKNRPDRWERKPLEAEHPSLYVDKQLDPVIQHLREKGIAHDVIVKSLAKKMLKFLTSNPYGKTIDQDAIRADLEKFRSAIIDINLTLRQYDMALERAASDTEKPAE